MRQKWLFLVLYVILFLPATVYAQGPTPPPSLAEICFPEGKFHSVECFKAVLGAKGPGGIFVLAIIFLFIYLLVTPSGKAFQSWVQDKVEEWLHSHSASTPPAEIQRREAEYLAELEKSETLRQPEEIASQFDVYLNTLHTRENILKPSEDKVFVDLESGLSIPPRIGLSVKIESNQSKSFAEQKTFNDLAEALNCVDEQTGYPYPVLALLGEPGAGKSTLLRKLARQVVQERIDDSSKPLPIYVSLSAHKSGSPLTFLRQYWKKMLGFDGLDDALANGRVWLFLDGLNEMPRTNYDTRVVEWRAFLRAHCFANTNGNRTLIACRIADYGEGVDAPRLLIHSMDDERIQQFLKKRTPDHADALWSALEKDHDEGRGAMYELAQIPFWLVMISRLSGKDGLPRNRAGLISRFIREWLDYETNRDGGRPLSDIQRNGFMEGMTKLAWTGLSRSQNYTFREGEARKLLFSKQGALAVNDMLGLARDCSLLSEESGGLRFQHQLLQEYFAACELADQFLAGKNLSKLWKTPWRRWKFVQSKWDPLPPSPLTGWEEAVILAVGMLDAEQAERLALAVLSHNPPLAARGILESGVVIGENISEKVKHRLQADLQNPRVRLPARLAAGKMLAKLGDPRLLKQRGEVELTKGEKIIFIVPDWVNIPAGNFQMGTTPAQSWLLKLQRADVYSNEQPAHSVQISAFKMARFPVTVAEYRCFMDAGGYENDNYWKEENSLRWRNALLPFEESYQYQYIRDLRENKETILKQLDVWVQQKSWSPAQAENLRNTMNSEDDNLRKRWEDNENKKRNADGKVIQPWLWDNQQYTVDNQPVIGVSWYEARAYAAWLTEVLRKQSAISEQEEIRLPTEAEWEKAARGTSGRLWTWGNLWNSSYANSLEGRVMQPSTVGAYPKNKSPYGIQDMIGNVWEWCIDWYNENEFKEGLGKEVKDPRGPQTGNARVLRGGSWNYYRLNARCSYRDWYGPDSFGDVIGFRLVLLPIIQISAI